MENPSNMASFSLSALWKNPQLRGMLSKERKKDCPYPSLNYLESYSDNLINRHLKKKKKEIISGM